jgi:enamine deaminase RidA (YjgF/YER057c/UK114 family)
MVSKVEIKVKNLNLGGSLSIGMKAGPFIFLGSQIPMDLETGRLVKSFRDMPEKARRQLAAGMVMLDILQERSLAQTWRIYQNLKDILAEQGSSLDNVVHQRIFLKDTRDMASVEKVILHFMPNERPATTIVGATTSGVNEEIGVQVDIVALAGEEGIKRENISISELEHLTAPYPVATKAGQYIFTTPLAGVDPETGRPVNRLADLSPEDRELAEHPYDDREEAIMAQHLTIFRHIRRTLETQGTPLENIVHNNGWMLIPMQEYGSLAKVRRNIFGRPGGATATTAFPMSGIRRGDALFEYEVIALTPPKASEEYRKEILVDFHHLTDYYVGAVKAGPFVFTAGEVAIDTTVPTLINDFPYLKDEGRFLPYGRVHEYKSIMAEAWYIYQLLKSYTEANHSSMENVVHQSVYMVNPADYPAVERIATLFYGSKLPPTSLVPILGTSPFKEAKLEIEVVAVAQD